MPDYSYNKDYPFAAFITNLGKYNEGELVGEWVKFPTTAEELKEVFKRIGIGQKDDFGQPYEEWFITDYDCYVDGLYDKLGEYENLDELNYLASKLDEMDHYGQMVNVAHSTGLPTSAFSHGPGLGSSLTPASATLMWRLIFKRELPE